MTTPIIFPTDTARTRLSDPLSSHVAGDKSAATIKQVRDAVLILARQEGPISGKGLNALYPLRAERNGWKPCDFDSPRKRAGDLAADGLLTITNPDDPRGTPHLYAALEGDS